MKPTTKAQRHALHALQQRAEPATPYRAFRRRFNWHLGGYLGGIIAGVFYGIETDGHTHT